MQIRFSYDTKYGLFSDALNLPEDHNLTDDEIELLKIQRKNNWIEFIDNTQLENQNIDISQTITETTIEPNI